FVFTLYTMKRHRGFKLGRKLAKVFNRITRFSRKPIRYYLWARKTRSCNPILSNILKLARYIQRGAKGICFPNSDPGYIHLGQEKANKPVSVPKGQLAVYVGQSDDDTKRVLVPVIYFNHPLFVELLKKSERVYGFKYPGGIMIPCGISDFERVQMRIAAGDCSRHRDR
ncbi:Auxin_inducible domain-containing protein, partial [Cephalotus follicularis]